MTALSQPDQGSQNRQVAPSREISHFKGGTQDRWRTPGAGAQPSHNFSFIGEAFTCEFIQLSKDRGNYLNMQRKS